MPSTSHILVVDDQPDIREALCEHLDKNGFVTSGAEDAAKARHILAQGSVDIVILDIMMPGEDGLSLCRYLRERDGPPVILLTALADDTDRIVGLEIGADDYVTKPFNPRELIARIRSVLRRTASGGTVNDRFEHFGAWRFDNERAELRNDKAIVPLSTGEFKLLKIFLARRGETMSRDELMRLTKGREAHAFERSLDNMISRLRRKIETDPANPEFIKTVWGGGYEFTSEKLSP